MRRTCLQTVYEIAREDERIVFVGSDLGYKTLQNFSEELPDRFIMEGVNEANVVGLAAGLALSGKIVYVNTIATFLTRRCYEQVVLDLCLHNARVRLIGNGGGLVYAPLGPTHLALEDISLFSHIPNMSIVAPADAVEMKQLIRATVDVDGPMYIRLAKGGDPVITPEDNDFKFGKARVINEGNGVLVITTGITTKIAMDSLASLRERGINPTLLHYPTIKPFDTETLEMYLNDAVVVLVVEEHYKQGGLGSIVIEFLVENDRIQGRRVRRIGIEQEFPHHYGAQIDLLGHYNITSNNIVDTIHSMTKDMAVGGSTR